MLIVFFFQAEDGIRDIGVTGVQTCALPISAGLLTPDLLAALTERVKAPPEDGGLWSGPKVALWMARHLGLAKVHPQRGWEALKRIGWSIRAPRPRHPRAATPEPRETLKRTWTRRSHRPRRRIPIGRSRSGPKTSIVSA